MDNKKRSARKRHRQSLRRRTTNRGTKTRIRTSVRKVNDAIEAKDAAAEELYRQSASVLDAAASKGVIHKNAAARRKSRLARKLAAAGKS